MSGVLLHTGKYAIFETESKRKAFPAAWFSEEGMTQGLGSANLAHTERG